MKSLPRWIGWLLVVLAAVGVVGAVVALLHDNGSQWHRSIVGGSSLYAIDVTFARLLLFIAAGAVGWGLVLRHAPPRPEKVSDTAVRRHEWDEVFTHWASVIGVVLCIVTGTFLLRWWGNPLSLRWTYVLHFVGAGLVVGAMAHFLAYEAAGGRGRLVARSWRDVRNALGEVVGYLGIYRGRSGVFGIRLPVAVRRPIQRAVRALHLAPDPPDKYLATEKILSFPVWIVLLGIIVVTGVIKTLHYVYALPGGLLQGATFLHDGATIFLIAFLVIHAGSTILIPRNWPLFRSMFSTRVSRAYVREHLPGWDDELSAMEVAEEARPDLNVAVDPPDAAD